MDSKMTTLNLNNIWVLVPQKSWQNVLSCQWFYKLKHDDNGKIDRYKARLVINGMRRRDGIDFAENYAPIIKSATIRLMLSIAVTKDWTLRQLDVSNAFLHDILKEEVFMKQPLGNKDQPDPTIFASC